MVLSSESGFVHERITDVVVVKVRIYERRRELISED
jgi:hypothetical protein